MVEIKIQNWIFRNYSNGKYIDDLSKLELTNSFCMDLTLLKLWPSTLLTFDNFKYYKNLTKTEKYLILFHSSQVSPIL